MTIKFKFKTFKTLPFLITVLLAIFRKDSSKILKFDVHWCYNWCAQGRIGRVCSTADHIDVSLFYLEWGMIGLPSERRVGLSELIKQNGHHQSPFSLTQGRCCHLKTELKSKFNLFSSPAYYTLSALSSACAKIKAHNPQWIQPLSLSGGLQGFC